MFDYFGYFSNKYVSKIAFIYSDKQMNKKILLVYSFTSKIQKKHSEKLHF